LTAGTKGLGWSIKGDTLLYNINHWGGKTLREKLLSKKDKKWGEGGKFGWRTGSNHLKAKIPPRHSNYPLLTGKMRKKSFGTRAQKKKTSGSPCNAAYLEGPVRLEALEKLFDGEGAGLLAWEAGNQERKKGKKWKRYQVGSSKLGEKEASWNFAEKKRKNTQIRKGCLSGRRGKRPGL